MITFSKLKRNASNLSQTGKSTLATNATLVAAAWRMIDIKAKEVLALLSKCNIEYDVAVQSLLFMPISESYDKHSLFKQVRFSFTAYNVMPSYNNLNFYKSRKVHQIKIF